MQQGVGILYVFVGHTYTYAWMTPHTSVMNLKFFED